MTANHEHTPDSGHLGKLIWETIHNDVYETDLSYAGANNLVAKIMSSEWYAAEIAAAEQRGAVKALRDAAGAIEKNNIVFDGDHYQPCNSCMSIHMNWLDYRADQMEGDDA